VLTFVAMFSAVAAPQVFAQAPAIVWYKQAKHH
jgi:hypothetical protein